MQARSIHVGLNHVDAQRYGGWEGVLSACEADATAMAALAEAQGIARPMVLLTHDATHARLMAELAAAAAVLQTNDYLLLTFAGHGAWLDDCSMPFGSVAATLAVTGGSRAGQPGDEDDGRDEAWCLYDTYILDDELHDCFCRFAPGVRICVVSDCCFSGTVTRGQSVPGGMLVFDSPRVQREEPAGGRQRCMALRLANDVYQRDLLTIYQPRSLSIVGSRVRQPSAHVVALSACEDDQAALEGERHGLFTEHLLRIWSGGRYEGSHSEFITQIKAAMPACQQPCLSFVGEPNPGFLAGRPFTPDR